MIKVNYPEPSFRVKDHQGRKLIFDAIRKIWIPLTPEEWVRQNFLIYLTQTLQYPPSMIAVEKEIMLNDLKKRFDILIYNNSHEPAMLVECKSSSVNLDDSVLQQVLRYNISVPVHFLLITNGHYTYGWEKTEQTILPLAALPAWVNL